MSLIKKCPRCGARIWGSVRFCGHCGCDTADQAVAQRVRSDMRDIPTWSAEPPRPTETARYISDEEDVERMGRSDRIKLAAAIAAGAVIVLIALWMILRMNRPAETPELSEPAQTAHVITPAAESPAATATPRPTDTPAPQTITPIPAATAPPVAGPVVNDAAGVAYVAVSYASVYAEPGLDSEVIGTAENGDALTRTGVLDGWTRVLFEGREGFVRNADLTLSQPTPTPEPTPLPMDFEVDDMDDTIVVVSDSANLRRGPDTDFPIADNVPYGTRLHRTGVYEGWSQVEYGGEKVYISGGLIDTLPDEPEAEPTAPPAAETEQPPAEDEIVYADRTITMSMNANVRSGPGTEYDSLGIAEGGATLESSGRQGDWYIVSFNGQTGYIFAELVE